MWSLGQVYEHLISESNYYLEQIKICLSGNDHAMEEMSPAAKVFFNNNGLPDELIKGPPSNNNTPQPDSKEKLLDSMISLKAAFNHAAVLISKSTIKGKTKHPGLNYFNAEEWFSFAEMHLRHHLMQKKRIDVFFVYG